MHGLPQSLLLQEQETKATGIEAEGTELKTRRALRDHLVHFQHLTENQAEFREHRANVNVEI